jgi:excisionase family DNA binding protein
MPTPAATTATEVEWLSLGPASRLVGVDPDTLRRWADTGRVQAFCTPGGHRRFRRGDLQRFVQSRRPARATLSVLGATPDRLARVYARSYRASDQLDATAYEDLDRDAFRAEGRRLIAALLAYLDASTAGRRRFEADATASVRVTGDRLARSGVDVAGAVSAFVAARRPFLAELANLGRHRSLDVAAVTRLYDDAVAVLDRLLLELIDAFQATATKKRDAK